MNHKINNDNSEYIKRLHLILQEKNREFDIMEDADNSLRSKSVILLIIQSTVTIGFINIGLQVYNNEELNKIILNNISVYPYITASFMLAVSWWYSRKIFFL